MAKRNNSRKNNKKSNNGVKNKTQVSSELRKTNDVQTNNDLKNENTYNKGKTLSKAKRDLIYSSNDSTDEMSKLLKIVLIVTGVMIVFYGITTLVTKKVNAVKTAKLGKTSGEATIQYDSIIIGSMLKMEGQYYVLIQNKDDVNSSEYDTLLKSIEANDDSPKIYTADLDSSFNKKYLAKDSNYDSDLTKFKVKCTTLVEIRDHEIEDTFDSYESIKEKLDELK